MKNDLISRTETVEEVSKALKGTFVEYEDIAEKIINKVPSAQQWIPCSERMPEYDAPALLSTAWSKTEIGWWTQRGWVIVPASYRELKQDAVVAWMPLPEPYRGDEK